MAAIVIHKWVPTHGIHFIPRFCPQNPTLGTADQPPRACPVRPYTGIWLQALAHRHKFPLLMCCITNLDYPACGEEPVLFKLSECSLCPSMHENPRWWLCFCFTPGIWRYLLHQCMVIIFMRFSFP